LHCFSLNRIESNRIEIENKQKTKNNTQTQRELGLQVAGVIKQLASASPEKIFVMSLMEGSKNRRQQLWAVAEPPHIIVGKTNKQTNNKIYLLDCLSFTFSIFM
jgi:superfamily II DNA/RNA helicase